MVSAVLALLIFQLIRGKKLKEQYSLLWFAIVAVMFVLSVWGQPLTWLSEATGVQLPSNTLFVLAILFLFGMALHFSLLVSRLTDQSKMLAQKLALLDRDLRKLREESAGKTGAYITEDPAGAAADMANGGNADDPPLHNPNDERD